MKILIMQWKSFGHKDIIEALKRLNIDFECMPFDNHGELHHDITIETSICQKINSYNPDFVFSFNYFPIISNVCNTLNTKYIAWVYDNPQVLLYSCTIINPCNIVFTFDKSQANEFQRNRIMTVHYMPLAADTVRLSSMNANSMFFRSQWCNKSDIAFIGSLYTESHQFYNRLNNISPYTRGYLEGLMATQKKIFGYNFIEDSLHQNPDIVEDMYNSLPMSPDKTSVATREYLFGQYVINRQITAIERTELLAAIGQKYTFDLYTQDSQISISGAINHGPIDYYDMAPYVFKNVKINLNFTLRSIVSGIPLRCFDILGSGGFLLTNYQTDFDDCYIAGEDYVYFEDTEDMLSKIEYYLTHEKERKAIAQNGLNKTSQFHSYDQRILKILEYL